MSSFNRLSISAMVSLDALVKNNFIITNAALDLNTNPSTVSDQVTRLMNIPNIELFTYKNKATPKRRRRVKGLSEQGKMFYQCILPVVSYVESTK